MITAAMIVSQFAMCAGILLYVRYELRRASRILDERAAEDRAAMQAMIEADRARLAAMHAEDEAFRREMAALDEEAGLSPEGRPR